MRRVAGRASLEASGNITLDTIRAYAETGVDRIATGALTHSAPWLDLALDVDQVDGDEPAGAAGARDRRRRRTWLESVTGLRAEED